MYIQNFSEKASTPHVVSFPNKDSILQMQSMKSNEKDNISKTKEPDKPTTENESKINSGFLIIVWILLGIADKEEINTDMFELLAGMLLTL